MCWFLEIEMFRNYLFILYMLKRARFILQMEVIIFLFVYKKQFLCETFFYTQKTKNPVWIRSLKKARIMRALLRNKTEIWFFLINNSLPKTLCAKTLKTIGNKEIVRHTIQ